MKKERAMFLIEEPTDTLIKRCIDQFNKEQKLNENAVRIAFSNNGNDSVENILIKVIVLNDRYSTYLNANMPSDETKEQAIFTRRTITPNVVQVAEKIFSFEKNGRFESCNNPADICKLIDDLQSFEAPFRKPYSFMTKYCSFRIDENIPIVDNYVRAMLWLINEKMIHKTGKGFTGKFTNTDLAEYHMFYSVIEDFSKVFAAGHSVKDVDKYLWQYGKNLLKEGFDIRTVLY